MHNIYTISDNNMQLTATQVHKFLNNITDIELSKDVAELKSLCHSWQNANNHSEYLTPEQIHELISVIAQQGRRKFSAKEPVDYKKIFMPLFAGFENEFHYYYLLAFNNIEIESVINSPHSAEMLQLLDRIERIIGFDLATGSAVIKCIANHFADPKPKDVLKLNTKDTIEQLLKFPTSSFRKNFSTKMLAFLQHARRDDLLIGIQFLKSKNIVTSTNLDSLFENPNRIYVQDMLVNEDGSFDQKLFEKIDNFFKIENNLHKFKKILTELQVYIIKSPVVVNYILDNFATVTTNLESLKKLFVSLNQAWPLPLPISIELFNFCINHINEIDFEKLNKVLVQINATNPISKNIYIFCVCNLELVYSKLNYLRQLPIDIRKYAYSLLELNNSLERFNIFCQLYEEQYQQLEYREKLYHAIDPNFAITTLNISHELAMLSNTATARLLAAICLSIRTIDSSTEHFENFIIKSIQKHSYDKLRDIANILYILRKANGLTDQVLLSLIKLDEKFDFAKINIIRLINHKGDLQKIIPQVISILEVVYKSEITMKRRQLLAAKPYALKVNIVHLELAIDPDKIISVFDKLYCEGFTVDEIGFFDQASPRDFANYADLLITLKKTHPQFFQRCYHQILIHSNPVEIPLFIGAINRLTKLPPDIEIYLHNQSPYSVYKILDNIQYGFKDGKIPQEIKERIYRRMDINILRFLFPDSSPLPSIHDQNTILEIFTVLNEISFLNWDDLKIPNTLSDALKLIKSLQVHDAPQPPTSSAKQQSFLPVSVFGNIPREGIPDARRRSVKGSSI